MAKESVGEYMAIPDMLNGKGMAQAHVFFAEQADPGTLLIEIVLKPGAYAGYHEHVGHDSIIYVVSGKAENYQDGKREILGPGDAVLTKAGQRHAVKNIGDVDLKSVEVCTVPGGTIDIYSDTKALSLPAELSDW